MDKKTLIIATSLAALALPALAFASTLGDMASSVSSAVLDVGVPAVIIGWIIAGILWLLSAGSPEKTGTAKKAIVACVIGTIIVVLAGGSQQIISLIKDTFNLAS